ncbi:MAG: hypothetical protein IJT32_04670 [Lachnospiraceae bacterium]|nr:hypothetical protein [Lachnospiraceae bacterium]
MRLTDRVIEEQRKMRLQKERETDNQQDELEEDVTGMTYAPRPSWGFLNDYGGVFSDKKSSGINTNPSVFEKGTLFHVTRKDDD